MDSARIGAAKVQRFRKGNLVDRRWDVFPNLLSMRAEVNSAPSSAIPGC